MQNLSSTVVVQVFRRQVVGLVVRVGEIELVGCV